MIGYPFDSQVTFDAQGNPQYDRAVSSKPLKELIRKLFTTGVMPNPSTNLQVVEGVSGLTTIVKAGFCIIEGGLKLEEEDKTMMHQAADTTYDRIDTVVMRWNDNDNARICALYVLAGTPSATPVRPTLNREGSVYEIGLADVLIKANSTAISQQRITDTRYETERCGVISSISEFDTDTIYAQVQADLAGFKADEEADFLAWFDEMKDQLSEDAAGNLQNQIGSLSNLETTNKESLVGAINEVKNATPDDMTGATASTAGAHGLVPAPAAGDENKVLKGNGTWGTADEATVRYDEATGYVQCKDSQGWFNWKLASRQLVDQIPIMTGNSSPKGLCTASNSLSCQPFQAFNRTSSNYWKPAQGTTGWVDYEFEEVAEIVKVLIVAGGTADGMTVIANHSLSIQYSMDGLVYNTIATLNNSLKNLNYEFDSPIQMKHLRILYNSCNVLHQGQYRYTAVDYIEAFGH